MSNFKPTPGEELRLERIRRGISQDRLARMMGVARGLVSAWETGAVGPDFTERCVERMERQTLAGLQKGAGK